MAQQYALSELTLENKLVDERQKSAQLDNRIANQVEKTNQLQQRNDELEVRLTDTNTKVVNMEHEIKESLAKNEEIIEAAVQVKLLTLLKHNNFLLTLGAA